MFGGKLDPAFGIQMDDGLAIASCVVFETESFANLDNNNNDNDFKRTEEIDKARVHRWIYCILPK